MSDVYVHGYSADEAVRLTRQANILAQFIHGDVSFAPGSQILEIGCGVGAQTVELAAQSSQSKVTALDRSIESLRIAEERVRLCKLENVELCVASVYELPFPDASFDGVFVCFVLEHLPRLDRALSEIKRVLRPGAKLHAFEGDHGSVLACPDDPAIDRLVAAVSEYQRLQGGDPYIGRRLCPILASAGFRSVSIQPCVAYSDATRPAWIDSFTQSTFIDMMKLQREAVLEQGLLSASEWRDGIAALLRTTNREGSFSYTFFRATALR